jgi:hypothetical protein
MIRLYDLPMARLLTLLLLVSFAARAQDAPPERVSGARALETVKRLASDEFEGRKSGLASGQRAEEWMAERCKEIGLQPWNGFTFFHEFKASVTEEGGQPVCAIEGAKPGAYLKDFVTLIYSGKGKVDAEVVFVGYGIHAPDKGRDDYAGLDVKGKIVLAVRGKPEGSRFDEERYIGYKSSTAFDRGAAGFLLCEGDNAVPGTIQEKYHRAELPAVWVAGAVADELLRRAGKPGLAAQKEALEAGKAASFPLGVKVRLEIEGRLLRDRPMRNVVGVWRGTGESDEYVVLGAHLDHVGTGPTGTVFNGADDNASGSSMLLEVARAVCAKGRKFRRHLVFVWFAAEEQGLTGSWAFVKKPPIPLEKIAVMINTDMVGQGKPVLAVGGAEVYPRDAGFLDGFALDGFETKPFRAAPNSDHYPFQTSGVPAFFVHTQGPHPNYHQPGDDWQNIKPELLETAGRFVRGLAERAAGDEHPYCRPHRKAEYVWHDANIVDLFSDRAPPAGAGVDVRVQWFGEDFVGIDRALTEREKKDAPENVLTDSANLGGLLRDLRGTVVLGLRGKAAARVHRPARRLGVLLFAPWLGDDPAGADVADLLALAREKPCVLVLHGAPEDLDLAQVPGPIVLDGKQAERWRPILAQRKEPWLVALRLGTLVENKPPVWSEVARTFTLQRTRYGARHVQLFPGDFHDDHFGRQAPTLVPGLIDAMAAQGATWPELHAMLGGNMIAMLEDVTK